MRKLMAVAGLVAALVLPASVASAHAGDNGGGHTPVTICHKPGTPAEHTIVVDDDAVPAHLAHGDYLGPCVDTPPPTEPPPTTEPPVDPPTTTPPVVTPPAVTPPVVEPPAVLGAPTPPAVVTVPAPAAPVVVQPATAG